MSYVMTVVFDSDDKAEEFEHLVNMIAPYVVDNVEVGLEQDEWELALVEETE